MNGITDTARNLTDTLETFAAWRAAFIAARQTRTDVDALTPYIVPGCDRCHRAGRFDCPEHGRAAIPGLAIIGARSVEKLRKRIAKYARKAVRCDNGATPGMIVSDAVAYPYAWRDGLGYWNVDAEEMFAVALTGSLPTMADGWELLGRIDHIDGGNVVVGARDKTMPEGAQSHAGTCDHCGKVRKRSQTYALRNNADGSVKFVGRNCLADFLRDSDVDALMGGIEWACESNPADDSESDFPRSSGSFRYAPTRYLLACAARAIREDKRFVKSGSDQGTPTVWRALDCDRGSTTFPKREPGIYVSPEKHIPADYERADAALEFVKTLNGPSDYESNLRVILAGSMVNTRKHAAFAVSIFAAMDRAATKRVAATNPGKVSAHVGTVGSRVQLTLTVKATPSWESDYGVQFANIMEDDNGNVFVWKSGNRAGDPGERLSGKCSIKGHGERNGVAQTMLTRCSLIAAELDATPVQAPATAG